MSNQVVAFKEIMTIKPEIMVACSEDVIFFV